MLIRIPKRCTNRWIASFVLLPLPPSTEIDTSSGYHPERTLSRTRRGVIEVSLTPGAGRLAHAAPQELAKVRLIAEATVERDAIICKWIEGKHPRAS